MTNLSERIANLPPEKRALLEARLLRERVSAVPIPAIPRRTGTGPAPLSFAQQRLWFLDQLHPDRAHYNLPLALRLIGALDVPSLSRALGAIIARHEALRTTFSAKQGEPIQTVAEIPRIAIERRDLMSVAESERGTALRRILAEELARPFDLTRDVMLRAVLVRESDRSHVLVLMMHHIASDGWSVGVLLHELAELYQAESAGSASALAELPIQYADYAVWQRDWLRGGVEEAQLAFWKKSLEGDLPLLSLPTDRPRPARQTFAGAQVRRTFSRALAARLEALSRAEGATPYMTLLTSFFVLLCRLSGQEDILVGTPLAGRSRVETESLIGFFVNTIVIRGDLSGNPTIRELLARVKERSLGAYAHQDLPFERLVEELHPDRDVSRSPLFEVMFAFENYSVALPSIPGLEIQNVEIETIVSNFDVTMDVALQEQGLVVSIEYNTDLFDRATIERWLDTFQVILEGVAADPSRRLWDLPVLTASERERLVETWNAFAVELPSEPCVHDLFEASAERTPAATAVETSGEVVTYADLDRRANQLAHRLRELGIGPDVPVGVCLERSADLPVALLGVLKAGGAYVPLDPAYPATRLQFLLEDTGAPVLLTHSSLAAVVGEGAWKTVLLDAERDSLERLPGTTPESGVTRDHLAYIIHTSGSTGRPKGVMVPHRALVNHAAAIRRRFGLRPSDRVLQFASIVFDVAAEEMFPTWASGGAVLLRPDEMLGVAEFEGLVQSRRPTVVNLPSGFWHEWVSDLDRSRRAFPDSLRLVIAGSERVLAERLRSWMRLAPPAVRWMNGYGPSETTITATLYEPPPGDLPAFPVVPIGRPISNVRTYVVDGYGGLVPTGAVGELWIGGEGVARGYWRRPELTAERFVADPFGPPGARVFRTGDRVRHLASGDLEFLGRQDDQVKIRGFRVELGEIEAVLEKHPAVREAAVTAHSDGSETRLASYVALDGGEPPTGTDLRFYLKERLPAHMIPSAFVVLPELPRTPSGKVDRRRLPDPGPPAAHDVEFIAPRTPVERAVAEIWADLLHVARVGAADNFFDLGGHSLLAMQVVSRLREMFSVELPLRALFEAPRVEELALVIAQIQAERASPDDLARLLEELEKDLPTEPHGA